MNIKNAGQFFITSLAIGVSFVFTLFVFLNSYEVVSFHDLPYIHAINVVEARQITDVLDQYTIAPSDDDPLTGISGTPYSLKVPSQNISLRLTRGMEKNHQWFTQAGRAHALTVRSEGESSIEHLLIYVDRDWRTIGNPQLMLAGQNLFVDTREGWRYMYRISDGMNMKFDERLVVPESNTPLLLLIVQDSQQQISYVMQAELADLQNIQN